jgi:hypothetical protein
MATEIIGNVPPRHGARLHFSTMPVARVTFKRRPRPAAARALTDRGTPIAVALRARSGCSRRDPVLAEARWSSGEPEPGGGCRPMQPPPSRSAITPATCTGALARRRRPDGRAEQDEAQYRRLADMIAAGRVWIVGRTARPRGRPMTTSPQPPPAADQRQRLSGGSFAFRGLGRLPMTA